MIAAVAVLLLILTWIITSGSATARWISLIAVVAGSVYAEFCVAKYDRPILPPDIEAIAFVNNGTPNLGLDMEVLIKNGGLVSGYADNWGMSIFIDGKGVESRQLYGRPLPSSVVNEPELDGEEFPPGKPVRGWLFFEFTSLTFDAAKTYFSCGSQQMDKVKFKLSISDSKMHRYWEETKSLAELGPSACIPLPLGTRGGEPPKPPNKSQTKPSSPSKSAITIPPKESSSPPILPPSQTVNAQNGIGAIGSTLINPQVYNYGYIAKNLSNEQAGNLANQMRPLADGTDRGDLITSQIGDTNSLELALQLVKIFRNAGWNLPGSGYNQALMTNPPESLLILVHSAVPTPDGKVDGSSLPAGAADLGKALQAAGISVAISVDEKIPLGKFRIIVGMKP